MGDAPTVDAGDFHGYSDIGFDPATVYYLPGTIGWTSTFAGLPTALWYLPTPRILNSPNRSVNVQSNGFGFAISWATNSAIVVESCTNMADPVWVPLWTNTLVNGTTSFSDPLWTNSPGRYYRISAP